MYPTCPRSCHDSPPPICLLWEQEDSVSIAVYPKLFHQKTLQKDTCLLPGELLLHTLCYGTCSISGQKMLQRVVRTPQRMLELNFLLLRTSRGSVCSEAPAPSSGTPAAHHTSCLPSSNLGGATGACGPNLQGVLGGADPPPVPAPAFSHLQLIPDNQLTLLHSLKDQLLLSLLAELSLNWTCSRTSSCGRGCFNKRLLLPGSWVLVFDFAFVFCLDSACSTQ